MGLDFDGAEVGSGTVERSVKGNRIIAEIDRLAVVVDDDRFVVSLHSDLNIFCIEVDIGVKIDQIGQRNGIVSKSVGIVNPHFGIVGNVHGFAVDLGDVVICSHQNGRVGLAFRFGRRGGADNVAQAFVGVKIGIFGFFRRLAARIAAAAASSAATAAGKRGNSSHGGSTADPPPQIAAFGGINRFIRPVVNHKFFILFLTDIVNTRRMRMGTGIAQRLIGNMIVAPDGNANSGIAVTVDGIDVHAA